MDSYKAIWLYIDSTCEYIPNLHQLRARCPHTLPRRARWRPSRRWVTCMAANWWPASSWNMFSLGCESPWINVMLWSKCVCVLEMASNICVFANETTASYSFSIVIVVCTYLLYSPIVSEFARIRASWKLIRSVQKNWPRRSFWVPLASNAGCPC